jgi:polar amino acid transport system substrate-binding protein
MTILRMIAWLLCALLASNVFAADAPSTENSESSLTKAKAAEAVPVTPIVGETTLARIDRTKTLRVGIATNVPWVMHDKGGEWMGFEIDAMRRLAQEMEWKVEFVPTSWTRLMLDLRTNQFDVIASGFSITPQRARLVRFSNPYGDFDISVVVNKSKLARGGLKDVSENHLRVGARKGSVVVDYAHTALPAAQIVEVDDEEKAIADLREGKLDAYAAEAPLPKILEDLYADKLREIGGDALAHTAHGFAVRQSDTGLLGVLNAWIVFENSSGWLKSRSNYWFDGTDWAERL